MALKYFHGGVTYTVHSASIDSRLYEKRVRVRNASNVQSEAYFERDDWTPSPETTPPEGSRLKISNGTYSYHCLLAAERLRGNFGDTAFSGDTYTQFKDLPGGTYGDWTEVASQAVTIDRRSRWTDWNDNFVFYAYSTILFGQSLRFRVVLTWTDHNGLTQTSYCSPNYNPIWPQAYNRDYWDTGTYQRIYPKPGTTVAVSFQAKGGMGADNNLVFVWLKP